MRSYIVTWHLAEVTFLPFFSCFFVLWHCWLGIRKSIRPVKKLSDTVLAWLSVWIVVQIICIWPSWCHCHPSSLASVKSRMVYLSGAGLPRLSGKKAVKCMYVCVYCIFFYTPTVFGCGRYCLPGIWHDILKIFGRYHSNNTLFCSNICQRPPPQQVRHLLPACD